MAATEIYQVDQNAAFDFRLLPDDVFMQILSYFPWRQQLRYRGVSSRWSVVCNRAFAASTKIIDDSDPKFCKMPSSDFAILIPFLAKGVRKITLHDASKCVQFQIILSATPWLVFRSLRQIDFGRNDIDCNTLISILALCPKLNSLSSAISSMSTDRYETRELCKSLVLDTTFLTDRNLIAVADTFPNLSSFILRGHNFLTNAGLFWFLSKYASTLERLEISGLQNRFPVFDAADFGSVDGFVHLVDLSLPVGARVCDQFMKAVSIGCPNLTTLELDTVGGLTNRGLSVLASLTLRRLNISDSGNRFNDGVTKIALEGHLEQLLAKNIGLSPSCLKSCLEFCPRLKLLDSTNFCRTDLTVEEAVDMVNLCGRREGDSRAIIRTRDQIWKHEKVREAQNRIRRQNRYRQHRLVIDFRPDQFGFLKIDTDFDIDLYEEEIW